MTAKHTPTPWTVTTGGEVSGSEAIGQETHWGIARFSPGDDLAEKTKHL